MRNPLRPISCRNLGLLRTASSRGEVAFFLGAGVDRLLWGDTKAPDDARDPANWVRMLRELHLRARSHTSAAEPELDELISRWPTEIAFLARAHLGDSKFLGCINESIMQGEIFRFNFDGTLSAALCAALVRTNLIVTTNYSTHIYDAIRRYLDFTFSDNGPRPRLVALNREDLKGFLFPEPVVPTMEPSESWDNRTIYLIHIHGRCSPGSFPILDAWGYNIAQEDDPEYRGFLNDLFTHRHVVTVGVSWTDVPLRTSAAYVRRSRPYLQRAHLDLRYTESQSELKASHNPRSSIRGWVNAMRSVYGVDVVHSTPEDQKEILHLLNAPSPWPDRHSLTEVADFLDYAGDYESTLQTDWLASLGNQVQEQTLSRQVEQGVSLVFEEVKAAIDRRAVAWEVLARIERHLRHHVWMYTFDTSLRAERRRSLWEALYRWIQNESTSWWNSIPPRIQFEFMVGAAEIHPKIVVDTGRWSIADRLLNERASLGSGIWLENTSPDNVLIENHEKLALQLLDVGWESMAAKVFSDRAFWMAELSKTNSLFSAGDVQNEGLRTSTVASAAGCTRRKVKGDVLAAIWSFDPREARAKMLGEFLSGSAQVEPGVRTAIAAGLIGCHLRLRAASSKHGILKEVADALGEIGMESKDLTKRDLRYWAKVSPIELGEGYLAIADELEQ